MNDWYILVRLQFKKGIYLSSYVDNNLVYVRDTVDCLIIINLSFFLATKISGFEGTAKYSLSNLHRQQDISTLINGHMCWLIITVNFLLIWISKANLVFVDHVATRLKTKVNRLKVLQKQSSIYASEVTVNRLD